MCTNDEIVQRAKQHGLDIKEDSLQRNDSGLDFHVVFATDLEGEDWVLRIPRRSDVVKRSSKEKQILDLVGRNLSVQAPKWKIYSEELIAYPLLQGVPAGTIDMEAKAYVWESDEKNLPDTFIETLAKAMVELHGINHSDAKSAGLSIHTPEELRHVMKERMDKQAGGHVWEKMFDHIVELAAAYPVAIAEFALSSGLEEYEEMAKQALGVKIN